MASIKNNFFSFIKANFSNFNSLAKILHSLRSLCRLSFLFQQSRICHAEELLSNKHLFHLYKYLFFRGLEIENMKRRFILSKRRFTEIKRRFDSAETAFYFGLFEAVFFPINHNFFVSLPFGYKIQTI